MKRGKSLRDFHHDFAVVLPFFEKFVSFDRAFKGNTWPICGINFRSLIHCESCRQAGP